MVRLTVIAVTLGITALFLPAQDETAKSKDQTTTAKQTDGKRAKMSHAEQIEAMLKDHPFIDNPKGVLRKSKDFNDLKGFSAQVINSKYTERAFTGELWNHKGKGTYICKKCNCPLYRSDSKFESHCGWPSFDDEIVGTVTRIPDKDGLRVEIVCTNCGGHLGHVFEGERFTLKNTRHCVNSASLNFIPEEEELRKIILSDEAKKHFDREKEKADLKKADLKKSGDSKPTGQETPSDRKSGISK